jgi:rSAM/selenodomain-associated transferase 1
MSRALLIVGKAPVAGQTKTRLAVPPFSPDDAASLYRAFLLDTVQLALGLGWERVSVVHPRASRQVLVDLLPANVALLEQRGDGLGDALAFAFEATLASGFSRVVLIGSDNPTLPAELICEACAALDTHDVILGPSADGGYYLVGMTRPHLGLFEGIDWSTSLVYAQTVARADELELRVHAVPEWYDIDAPAELERLQDELRGCAPNVAPNTRAALDHLNSRYLWERAGATQAGGTNMVGVWPERSA